jgi:anti-sigma factor RsiW
MTLTGNNGGPTCREIRHLLGVYVVGAIEPSERSVVDDHLMSCQFCRDELAGLAGLPAMLSRVPVADVERLTDTPAGLPEEIEPPSQLLDALLGKVAVRRRSRLWRGAITVAAAAAVAAAGATAAVDLARPAAHTDVASAVNSHTGVAAVVDYSSTPWGNTAMRVQVHGIPSGTTCQLWVVGRNGRALAGQWMVQRSYGQNGWYAASSNTAPSWVSSFQLMSGGKLLVTIPAS